MHARTKVTVRYAETDRMGIVHHSNYPIWYEIARNDYIKMFGISYTDMENAGVMTPLLNLSCHFGIPALYEDDSSRSAAEQAYDKIFRTNTAKNLLKIMFLIP